MKNNKSTIKKRQAQLIDYLRNNNATGVTEIASLLNVSPVTIRRDLDFLEQKGLVERFFGGARLLSKASDIEPVYNDTEKENSEEKNILAQYAADMIENGDTVFMNSSSTALLTLNYIKHKSVIVITNNARSVMVPRDPGVELALTGGEVYQGKESLVGQIALNSLSRITATKCIIGLSGISVKGGLTTSILPETAINHMMLSRCSGPKIVVASGNKIGMEHNFHSGKLNDITHVITDSSADLEEIERIRSAGITVIIVEPSSK